MINSKRAHQAERSGCRSESEMLSFVASLRAVYITRQIQIYHFLIYTDFITSFIPCKKPITAVPTNLLYLLPIMSSPKSFNFRLFFKFLPRKTEQKMYDSHCILY